MKKIYLLLSYDIEELNITPSVILSLSSIESEKSKNILRKYLKSVDLIQNIFEDEEIDVMVDELITDGFMYVDSTCYRLNEVSIDEEVIDN